MRTLQTSTLTLKKLITELINSSSYTMLCENAEEMGARESITALVRLTLAKAQQLRRFKLNDSKISNSIEDRDDAFEFLWVLDVAVQPLSLDEFIYLVFEHINTYYTGNSISLRDPRDARKGDYILKQGEDVPTDAEVEFTRMPDDDIVERLIDDIIHVLDVQELDANPYSSGLKPSVEKALLGLVDTVFRTAVEHRVVNTGHDLNIEDAIIEDDDNNWVLDLVSVIGRSGAARLISSGLISELLNDLRLYNENDELKDDIIAVFGAEQIARLREESSYEDDDIDPTPEEPNFKMPEWIHVVKMPSDKVKKWLATYLSDDLLFPLEKSAYVMRGKR